MYGAFDPVLRVAWDFGGWLWLNERSKPCGQIQLRREFLTAYGRRLWGARGFPILGVTRDSHVMIADGPNADQVALASVTGSGLADWSGHAAGDEFAWHLRWKEAGGVASDLPV